MSAANADEFLDEIATQIRAQTVPAYPADAVSAALADKFKPAKSSVGWQSVFRRRPVQFITAASLLLIVAGFVWLGSPFGNGNGFAFAEVQQAIGEVKSVSYQILYFNNAPSILAKNNLKTGEPRVTHVKAIRDGPSLKSRAENSGGSVSITNKPEGKRIVIEHPARTAVIEKIYPSKSQIDPDKQFLTQLRNVPEHATKRIGERTVAGREVFDFNLPFLDQLYTVAIDAKTKLPIRMEQVIDDPRSKDQGIQEVFTDFLFDAVFDDSQFNIEAPPGYAVRNHVPPDNRPPSPAPDPLIISPDAGIGPAKFGDNVAQIIRVLGQPDWQEERAPPGIRGSSKATVKPTMTDLAYDSRGFRLEVDHAKGLQAIYCLNQIGAGDKVLDFLGKTKEGLTIHASREELLKAYGEPDESRLDNDLIYYTRGYQFFFYPGGLGGIRVSLPEPARPKRTKEGVK